MIGETRSSIDPAESKSTIALRDAVVVFLVVLVANLLKAGYPPTVEVLYTSVLSGVFMGIVSYMHALGIKKPRG